MVRAPRTAQQRMASAYQGAIEAVLAVVICTGGGYWIDTRFETAPVGLFVGLALGFTSFLVRLWRLRGLMVEPTNDSDDETKP
jgi:F0F1-type ATP synthase assembly protein I